MSSALPRHPGSGGSLSIIIVGNDALIEALPALPLQVAHACLAAGYDQALPLSWGDELVAEATLRALEQRPGEPAVLCACPFVRQRLLGSGGELEPTLLEMPAPPVAVARYVRFLYGDRIRTLTYLGRCPAGRSTEFDATLDPTLFFAQLRKQGIDATAQPELFEGVLPPDRRRFVSLPGGCPTPEALWQRANERTLVELEERDLPVELAQQLVERKPVLLDLAAGLGCACCGVTPTTAARSARIAVMSLEPPRANAPVVEAPSDLVELVRAGDRRRTPPDPATPRPEPLGASLVADRPATPGPTAPGSEAPPAATPRPPELTSKTRTSVVRPPYAVTPPRALQSIASNVRRSPVRPDDGRTSTPGSRVVSSGESAMTATAVLTTEPPSVTTKPSLSLPKRRSGLWASRALLPRARFSQPVATASRVPRAFLVRRASVQDRWNPVVAAPGTQPPEPSASSLVIPQDAEGTECTNAGPSTSTLVIPQHAEATEYDNAGTAGEVRSHAAPHDVAPAAAPSPTTAAAAPVPPPTSQRGHEDHGSLRGSTAAGPVYTIRPRRLEPERPSTIGIVLPVSFGVVLLTVAAVLLMVH